MQEGAQALWARGVVEFYFYQGQALGYEDWDKNWKENHFILQFDVSGPCHVPLQY
jgi:hypothetical protein